MLILAHSFPAVKYFAVPQVLAVTLFVYRHKRYNGVLKLLGVAVCSDAQHQLVPLAVDLQVLQNICGIGHVSFNDVVRCVNNFSQLLHDRCRNIRMSFTDMLKLLIRDDNMLCSDSWNSCFVNFRV